jgi:hypothetical protein
MGTAVLQMFGPFSDLPGFTYSCRGQTHIPVDEKGRKNEASLSLQAKRKNQ